MVDQRVNARQLDKIVLRVFGPSLAEIGFTHIHRRLWVRSIKAPIREVIRLETTSPYWGFSLDYAPHVWYSDNSRVEWHNREATVRFDLAYSPGYNQDRKMWWEIDDWHGLEKSQQSAQQWLYPTLTSAQAVFNEVQSVEDMLPLFEAKIGHPHISENSIQCRLAYAFTFAWLGREINGREQLALFKAEYRMLPRATSRELDQHFDALLAQQRHL